MPATLPLPDTGFWHDPAWPALIETRRACHSRACYRPHSHAAVSIGVVDGGHSVFATPVGLRVALSPGTLVVVPAHQVHACNPQAGTAWSYQMLYLAPDWWAQCRAEQGLPLAEPAAQVYRQPRLYQQFNQLNAGLFDPQRSRAEKEAQLRRFLVDELWPATPCHTAGPAEPTGHAPDAAQLQHLLQAWQAAEGPVPALAELAQALGLSRYQLIRRVRRHTGLAPHAWLLNQRIDRARAELRAGGSLAELACQLGFADQSHFQRVFKHHVGETPHRYRQRRA